MSVIIALGQGGGEIEMEGSEVQGNLGLYFKKKGGAESKN